MEGIGYWIFLLAMYLISTLAKKRKQKRAWEALDKDEEKINLADFTLRNKGTEKELKAQIQEVYAKLV